MNFKVPEEIIDNFCFSNFKEAKYNSSGEIHFNTPFVADRKMRLYVNPKKSRYFDQKRQIGGDFISFVSEYLEVSLKEASITLIREYSIKNSQSENIEYKEIVQVHKDIDLPNGLNFFFESNENSRTYKIARKYLLDRKIPLGDLGYIYDPKSDPKESYHNRIFVPFYENGKLVYFIARTFEKDNPFRYKNPTGIDAGKFVFQIDKLQEDVFIFEGVFDALSLNEPQVGTAMLSNKIKQDQVSKILDLAPKRIIFVTENDKKEEAIKAGKKNLLKNIKTFMLYKPFSLNIKFYIFNPPKEYKDFNEYAVETGKHNIDINECIEWNPRKLDISNFSWGSYGKVFS